MQFSTLALVTFAATAMAAPTNSLVAREDLEISGDNAAELVKQYAPVYTLAPGAFAADDSNQSMGFLDFSGYVNFLVGLLQAGGQFIKDGGNALVNLDINKVGAATVNFFQGLMTYFNAFLAAVKQGTKFDKAVYEFLVNSGISDFLSSVANFIVKFSQTFLESPLLQGIIDVLKRVVGWLFGAKQTVQQTLGDKANTTGFDRALVAAQSVQSAAEKKAGGH
ncbi:hypothetical protein B0I72DRAFT_112369 [Yarrowia lipolytica]|jgi:hypothetical protein|uniref:YALI0F04598p n=2 Tax=Yarrowia lipolytica TaxID=4952 RepID=Q6C2W4_YARLI|nr:YALI0F04598p [Yarrowia lipolytica CLIB122]AOW06661.1 hypothetical protein YALI1_F07042g [Yarrowia lipolytica]KAB8284773.1 hypothetical protein BKA91DRAFT_164487 [Yarrowia lipolytica]KAE8174809.1 hypothetical protein BKA90DRAFT_172249 [Yarrowia lipolytica]KAJ8056117.1 hypothetical protein LXG23DRAFT_19150 [Yarrowia lipolytica]QNQ00545.1 Hypothetical protein YALI2_F00090g [Yarrowia lipolytica]|eukprot:XP_504998.1 YALI0F04598p [Yarrowia lipolytica CLIB122]